MIDSKRNSKKKDKRITRDKVIDILFGDGCCDCKFLKAYFKKMPSYLDIEVEESESIYFENDSESIYSESNSESDISDVESNISDVESDISDVESEVSYTESEVSDVESEVSDVESDISDVESEISIEGYESDEE